jgi:hypothetical protein
MASFGLKISVTFILISAAGFYLFLLIVSMFHDITYLVNAPFFNNDFCLHISFSIFSDHVFDLLVFHCCIPCPCKPHLLLREHKRKGWRLGRWVQERILSVGTPKSQVSRRYVLTFCFSHA